jgi:hypothetical protein
MKNKTVLRHYRRANALKLPLGLADTGSTGVPPNTGSFSENRGMGILPNTVALAEKIDPQMVEDFRIYNS